VQALDAGHCATPGVGSGTARRGTCRDPAPAGGFPFRGKGYRIPTLDEVLEKLPAGTILGIEVKAAGFEAALAARLRRWGGLDRLVIGSADDEVGARLRELLPEAHHYFPVWAAARLAVGAKLADGRLSHPDYDVLAIPKSAGGVSLATRGLIATAQRLSVMVAYFIIDDEDKMAELFRLGADAIMTDYPSRARAVATRLRLSRDQTP
jgi:glycerophosphoryl diester phosphodiesterase